MNYNHLLSAAALASLSFACAADPGTRPHDMSAADHQAAAQSESSAAEAHADQQDPSATQKQPVCSGKGGCWTSTSNPTAQHGDDAKQHRDLAAKHRAASTALADAEARSCAGVSAEDRDMSPFAHKEDIQSVSPLTKETKSGKGSNTKEVGVTVVFRAVEGLTAEWLQRVVDCHLARASSVGHDMAEMSYCPLVPKGAEATVTSAGNGFAVNISAKDQATVDEIKKRGAMLSSR